MANSNVLADPQARILANITYGEMFDGELCWIWNNKPMNTGYGQISKEKCIRGHEFRGRSKNGRRCLDCHNMLQKQYDAAKRS